MVSSSYLMKTWIRKRKIIWKTRNLETNNTENSDICHHQRSNCATAIAGILFDGTSNVSSSCLGITSKEWSTSWHLGFELIGAKQVDAGVIEEICAGYLKTGGA